MNPDHLSLFHMHNRIFHIVSKARGQTQSLSSVFAYLSGARDARLDG